MDKIIDLQNPDQMQILMLLLQLSLGFVLGVLWVFLQDFYHKMAVYGLLHSKGEVLIKILMIILCGLMLIWLTSLGRMFVPFFAFSVGGLFAVYGFWVRYMATMQVKKIRYRIYNRIMSQERLDIFLGWKRNNEEIQVLKYWLANGKFDPNAEILWGDYQTFRDDLQHFLQRRMSSEFPPEVIAALHENGFRI